MTEHVMESVHVHVDNTDDFFVTKTEEQEPEHFVCETFVLATAGGTNVGGANPRNDVVQILALDPLRKDAGIFVVDTAIVLCDTEQKAKNASNQVAGVPSPVGAYIPAGGNASVTGTGPMWAVNTTPATPCRVSVIINRRMANG